jgi:hypothetical protein
MGTVFKKTFTKPLPAGAEIYAREGQEFAPTRQRGQARRFFRAGVSADQCEENPQQEKAMKSLRTRSCASWIVVLAFAAGTQSQEKKPAGNGIDPATVAAYEKLGAMYGGWMKRDIGSTFVPAREYAEKGVPGFSLRTFPMAKLPDVAVPFGLDLAGSKATDAAMKELAGLKNLGLLNLAGTRITAAGLKDLAALDKLGFLRLGARQASVEGIKELAGLKNLVSLDLSDSQGLSEAAVKELAGLKNLAELGLRGTYARPAALKELAGLKSLTTLDISDFVTDATLHTLRDIGLLHTLTNATGKNGARPRSADEVISFNLSKTQVTAVGLKELAGFKNLASLRLRRVSRGPVTDAWLKELAAFPHLAALDLAETRTTGVGLKELGGAQESRGAEPGRHVSDSCGLAGAGYPEKSHRA